MFKDGKLVLKEESIVQPSTTTQRFWNILIVDDDPGLHEVTKLSLSGFEFERKKCRFFSAYSAKEAIEILQNNPNIALALVDVVMETEHAGLDLVHQIRNELKNKLLRIVLRTGQPGDAPEESVIHDYDINDYKCKSELTTQRLNTSIVTSLRAYRDMLALEKNRQGLKKIIESSPYIHDVSSLEKFLSAILEQLAALLHLTEYDRDEEPPSFIAALYEEKCSQIAGSGRFYNIDKDTFAQETHNDIRPFVLDVIASGEELYQNGRYAIYRPSESGNSGFVLYMEIGNDLNEMDKDLIRLFFNTATVAYENATHRKDL